MSLLTTIDFKPIRLPLQGVMTLILITSLMICGTAGATQPAGNQAVILSAGQADAILNELKEIRKLLESIDKKGGAKAAAPSRPPVPKTATVSIKGASYMGSPGAEVTVVEFTDFQCPYCKRFVDNTFPALKKEFVDSGKVKWVVRDLPLGFHKNARKAAQAAHCAGEQGKFWDMRSELFTNSKQLDADKLPGYANSIGLDMTSFSACLASNRHLAEIDQSVRDAGSVKITGTPTFVIGKAENDVVNGDRIVGARNLKNFQDAINKQLTTK